MNDQAKLLLNAYRPGGGDATDPAFAEALAQARQDPQLRTWFEDVQRFDQAIAGKLRDVAVPANLRSTILAGAKFSEPRRGWHGSRFWAVAAVIAVVASAFTFWFGKDAGLDRWQTESLAVLEGIEAGTTALDIANPQPAHLLDWLRAKAAPFPAAVPNALAVRPSFGCKIIAAGGRKVSLMCFDLGSNEQAHLFTTPRAGLKLAPPEAHPIFSRHRNWNLASWRSGEDVHMLATEIDETRLRALLPASIAARVHFSPVLIGEILPVR